jgi:putative transposase
VPEAKRGMIHVWSDHGVKRVDSALRAHRMLIFGKHASGTGLSEMTRERALKILDHEDGHLPKTVILRCRVRYFTDGAILGSADFVRGFTVAWQRERGRKYAPKVSGMRGSNWGDLAVIQGLRRRVFS